MNTWILSLVFVIIFVLFLTQVPAENFSSQGALLQLQASRPYRIILEPNVS